MDKKSKKEKPQRDVVDIFRESAKGMGRLKLQPHEAYEEELEKN